MFVSFVGLPNCCKVTSGFGPNNSIITLYVVMNEITYSSAYIITNKINYKKLQNHNCPTDNFC
jgi:hypothetical protein